MAGDDEQPETDSGFQWDDNSQLYYHARTGFYHDPQAGWYYNSRDGLYYKFEDGNYVLLDSNQSGDQVEMLNSNSQGETSEALMEGKEISINTSLDSSACNGSEESDYPPPPSEWLEDTLIDMFLSGYPSQAAHVSGSDTTMPVETYAYDDIEELEEGEWIPDDPDFWRNFSDKIVDEGTSEEEENWRAQYGQVSRPDEEWMSGVQMVDLWDWALVRGTKKDGKSEVFRLVGRLRKPSSKLHPSVPSGGGILKTAPVCEAHLDMVRVTSGRIYRLRNPSLPYLASLSDHDASNLTKDWGFPQLSIKDDIEKLQKSDLQTESGRLEGLGVLKDKSLSSVKLCQSKKEHIYRDRAAERRALHGGFGVGPGQKNSHISSDSAPLSPTLPAEESAAESLSMSFGAGSYARRILEGMGWKEGEALGHSTKGLIEPLQATGNKGTAGLGWDDPRRK
ncbi:uncharacterized protein LOC131021074 isoform X2 [Salvia miltiorrhiza]|uniref:uncharacterized protein LOC131021074 isoform X2 n=1 Tax=Salvia miltiorrhiza TaxID=226208 RepID=UPI0025AC6B79|nr:uncharacterized protein LOC131021074 isoform X2 [Salvia miltiorrhiza]